MNTWCIMAACVALADGIEDKSVIDIVAAIIGLFAGLIAPSNLALVIALVVWVRISINRPIMPIVAAGTLALCILAI